MHPTRVDHICEVLSHNPHWLCVNVELDCWDATADRDHTPYGFSVPHLTSVGTQWRRLFRFCAELLDQHLEGEPERIVTAYLNSILIHANVHASHPDMGADDLEYLVDRTLFGLDPELHRAVQRIRAKADSP